MIYDYVRAARRSCRVWVVVSARSQRVGRLNARLAVPGDITKRLWEVLQRCEEIVVEANRIRLQLYNLRTTLVKCCVHLLELCIYSDSVHNKWSERGDLLKR